jgi:hypothetical protein
MNPVHKFPPYVRKIHSSIIPLSAAESSMYSLVFRFSKKNTVWISHPCSACYMPHLLHVPDLITLTIFAEAYKLWNSSLCSLFQPHVTSFLLGANILWSSVFHFDYDREPHSCMSWSFELTPCGHAVGYGRFGGPGSSEVLRTVRISYHISTQCLNPENLDQHAGVTLLLWKF